MTHSPLRSATDQSNSGIVSRLAADRSRIERYVTDGRVHHVPNGRAMIMRANYPAFDGSIANGPYLRLGLSTGSTTTLRKQIGSSHLAGLWRPGTLVVTLPEESGEAACGPVSVIGLAIAPGATPLADDIVPGEFDQLARNFQDDATLTSLMITLAFEAEIHGADALFFEHGVALVLRRLRELCDRRPSHRTVPPLSHARFNRLLAYADTRLGEDISVADLAAIVGMDPSGFTRALKARTGLAPYAWLTQHRMDHAMRLLARGLPITRVAGSVGYANASKFAAAFRRVTGSLPSRWQ